MWIVPPVELDYVRLGNDSIDLSRISRVYHFNTILRGELECFLLLHGSKRENLVLIRAKPFGVSSYGKHRTASSAE